MREFEDLAVIAMCTFLSFHIVPQLSLRGLVQQYAYDNRLLPIPAATADFPRHLSLDDGLA